MCAAAAALLYFYFVFRYDDFTLLHTRTIKCHLDKANLVNPQLRLINRMTLDAILLQQKPLTCITRSCSELVLRERNGHFFLSLSLSDTAEVLLTIAGKTQSFLIPLLNVYIHSILYNSYVIVH